MAAIKALNESTTEKLAALETAVSNTNITLSTKLASIDASVQTGFANSEAQAKLIVAAIKAMNESTTEKLAALETAVSNTNTTLGTKLAAIETAVKEGFASVAEQEKLTREALTTSLKDGFDGTAKSIADINTALGRLSIEGGFYAADAKSMTISPSAWEAIKKDAVMYESFKEALKVTTPTITTSHTVAAHTCTINATLVSHSDIDLLDKKTTYNDNGVTRQVYKIFKMYADATYIVDNGNCGMKCYNVYVTDVRGEDVARYNFNGGFSGKVKLYFHDSVNKNFVKSAHIKVEMK